MNVTNYLMRERALSLDVINTDRVISRTPSIKQWSKAKYISLFKIRVSGPVAFILIAKLLKRYFFRKTLTIISPIMQVRVNASTLNNSRLLFYIVTAVLIYSSN